MSTGSAPLSCVDRFLDQGLLQISCPDPSEEDGARGTHRLRGQFLARQDRWDDLVEDMNRADEFKAATPAGMPVADLLCFGARADVVGHVEQLLQNGSKTRNADPSDGIEALELMLADDPSSVQRAIILAQAHMDLGWTWRDSQHRSLNTSRKNEAFRAHFDRARAILTPFAGTHADSCKFMTTFCTLNASGIDPDRRIAQDYERAIDLNPTVPGTMRALGSYMSPRWFGTYAELELEARRTAARTQQHWGAGGYTWVMFDVLAGDPVACERLDLGYFVEGLGDILMRFKDQHTANTLAAYCLQTLSTPIKCSAAAAENRAQIAACADWIVRDHLTEVHPLIWAHAAAGFQNNLHVPSLRSFAALGRQKALSSIAWLFRQELADGNQIVFTANGPVAEHC